MMRLRASGTLFVFLTLLSAALAAERPNVVVILADDLGWGGVSYHQKWAETPNIDRLATEGIQLDRFYVAPMCSPTRAGLLTGRYPIRFGLARAVIPPQRNFGLPVQEQTLADGLETAGYRHRGIFGKWHLGHHHVKWHPLSRGFTHFEGHYNGAIDYFSLEREGERDWHVNYEPSDRSGYSTDLIADAASEFIRTSASEDAPYFCYVPFNSPHSPFQAKPKDLRRYTKGGKRAQEATLLAMIHSLDQGVGQILEAIDDSGEAENTQVWFLSDNGGVSRFKRNNFPLHGSKLTTFEGGIRVVACVRWPRRWPGGRVIRHTTGYIDVLPTVLTTAGLNPADCAVPGRPLDGLSLDKLLSGESVSFPDREWYSYHGQAGAHKETIAIRTPEWKLVVIGPDVRQSPPTAAHQLYLYRMPGDLLEQQNVAKEYPHVVARLYSQLQQHRRLQPNNGVPVYSLGKQEFTPWKNWKIPQGSRKP